jgi:multiple sugar transport system substrate-binding protein
MNGHISRRGFVGAATTLTGAILAACATPGASSGGADTASKTGKVVELRAHARAGSEKDGYVKNVDAFNKAYEGKYHATYEGLGDDYYTPLQTAIAGGTVGDVHYAHTSNIRYQEFAVKGVAAPLDSYVAKDKKFNINDWNQRAQETMKVVDNKIFGLPTRGQVSWLFLYWNRDILKKAGVPEPTPNWTLDDLITNAKKLLGGQFGSDFYPVLHNQSGTFENVVANIRRFGGEFFQETVGGGKKCTMDSAQALQSVKFFSDNIKSGLFGPRTLGPADFGNGKGAFFFGRLAGERATVANAAKNAFEWTFDVVPKGPTGRRGGYLSIDMSQINTASKDKDGAWELLKWVTNKDSGVNLALQPEGSLTPGFRKDVYCDDRLLNDSRFPKTAMKANCDNIDQPDTYVFPGNYRLTQPGAVQEVLNKYINDMMDGKQEATAALLKQMTTEIQQVLDQPRL